MAIKIDRINNFSKGRLEDRQVTELIGMARGMLADGVLTDAEIIFLRKWLAASVDVVNNPLVATLYKRLQETLADKQIDEDERADLFEALNALSGNDFSDGELLKATTLPLCKPAPDIEFEGNRFTFTGVFVSGKRKDCERVTLELGGTVGGIAQKTRYLVIGEYATDAWIHSSFGRKIEKGVEFRSKGFPISIISEQHWLDQLEGTSAAGKMELIL
ncbi:BRCT domain-containing protein [Polycladidibacter hongkongensis]|uniref:BRCT domain-containing protein n=1 Tax=Polycladidibacter hongkongensis TaxID=1647556 RepID=UPI00082E73DB|nr:BRCT domain-containing protein [Pseudovibrio hongkongensis]